MAATAFSTPENACLERQADFDQERVDFSSLWIEDNRELCKTWVNDNGFHRVCLQFPDSYLIHSTKIYEELKELCPDAKFYILADTSYGSCCVDEIAASHVESDSIIHFGNACKSKVSRLPVLYIFAHLPFDCNNLRHHVIENKTLSSLKDICIIFDTGYEYILDEKYKNVRDGIKKIFASTTITFEKYVPDDKVTKDCFKNEEEKISNSKDVCIFIGSDSQTFFNLSMTVNCSTWFIYDPIKNEFKSVNPLRTNFIKKRYYYIEKCKDARKLGLIIATLTADGYLDIIKHIKEMAKSHGKRTYLISVGRINPAKLANFMEIDCFVLIGCRFNNLYTSREFFKPVVSVFEAEMALNPAWKDKFPEMYATDFKDFLPNGKLYYEFKPNETITNDVSLVTGRIRNVEISNDDDYLTGNVNNDKLVERKNQQVMQIDSGGVSFEDRTWKGLDPALENREPARLEKGRSGIPIHYTDD